MQKTCFSENKNLTSNNLKMNNFLFNVKQLKMNKSVKHIWQLIISTSNTTLEVPPLCSCQTYNTVSQKSICQSYNTISQKSILLRDISLKINHFSYKRLVIATIYAKDSIKNKIYNAFSKKHFIP